jgi:hypothetical protein
LSRGLPIDDIFEDRALVPETNGNRKKAAAMEWGRMKRIPAFALILSGFILAGCEYEEHEHRYGYRDAYRGREYREGRYSHRYRLSDETLQNAEVGQVDARAQE